MNKQLFILVGFLLVFAALLYSCGDVTHNVGTPSGVTAQVMSSNSISIEWQNASGAGAYNVYRNNQFDGTVATNGMVDSGLVNDTQYCYQVQGKSSAKDPSFAGDLSGSVCATTLP